MLGTNRQYVLDDKHFNMSTTPTTATATQNWTNCDMNSMNSNSGSCSTDSTGSSRGSNSSCGNNSSNNNGKFDSHSNGSTNAVVPAYNAYNQYTLQALNSHTSINTPVTGINTMTSTKSVEILTNTSSTQLGGPAYFFINTTTTNNNNNNNSNNSYQSNYDPLASDNIPNNRQIHLPSIQSVNHFVKHEDHHENRDILLCNPACTYTSPSENINDNLSIDDTPKKSVPFLPPLTVSHHHHHHHNPRNSINDEQCKKNAYKMYKNVYEDSDAANGSTNGIDYLPSINPDSCYLLNYGQPNQMGVMMQSDQVEQCPSLSTCGTELNSLSENNHSNNTNTTTNNHNNNNNTVENTIHRNPSNENPTQHTQRHLWDIKDMKLPKVTYYDPYELWPSGHCRRVYAQSCERARRHQSGWAMRNTNNHNPQVLKKSCLGVLECSMGCLVQGKPLSLRPAICDKARKKQCNRECITPGCKGRLVLRNCRGHSGYPVTHFWRFANGAVYFEAKGEHDHNRPSLKTFGLSDTDHQYSSGNTNTTTTAPASQPTGTTSMPAIATDIRLTIAPIKDELHNPTTVNGYHQVNEHQPNGYYQQTYHLNSFILPHSDINQSDQTKQLPGDLNFPPELNTLQMKLHNNNNNNKRSTGKSIRREKKSSNVNLKKHRKYEDFLKFPSNNESISTLGDLKSSRKNQPTKKSIHENSKIPANTVDHTLSELKVTPGEGELHKNLSYNTSSGNNVTFYRLDPLENNESTNCNLWCNQVISTDQGYFTSTQLVDHSSMGSHIYLGDSMSVTPPPIPPLPMTINPHSSMPTWSSSTGLESYLSTSIGNTTTTTSDMYANNNSNNNNNGPTGSPNWPSSPSVLSASSSSSSSSLSSSCGAPSSSSSLSSLPFSSSLYNQTVLNSFSTNPGYYHISSNSPNALNCNHSIHEVNYIHLYPMGPDQIAVNYCDDEYTQSTVNPGYTEFDTITQSSNTHEIGGSEWCQQSVYSTTPIHGVAQSMTNTNETQLMPGSDPCQVDYDIWTTTVNEAATPLHLQPSTAYTVHYPINDLCMEIFDSSSNHHHRQNQDQPQQHQQVQYFNTYNEIFDDSQNQLIDNEQFNDKSTDYIDFILNSSMNQSTPIGNCCLNQSNYQIQSKMIDHFSDDLDAEPTNEKEACSVQFKSNLSTHSANNNNNWSNQCLSHTSFLSETDRNEENHVDRREENEKSSESMMHPSTSNSSIGSMNSQNYEFNELGSHFYPQNIYQPMNRTQFSLKNTLCSSNNNNSSTHTNQPVTIDYWISTE